MKKASLSVQCLFCGEETAEQILLRSFRLYLQLHLYTTRT